MPDDRTIIAVSIEADVFVATCPHIPADSGVVTRSDDAEAVSELLRRVRAYRHEFERVGKPVPWDCSATAPAGAMKTYHITGLMPAKTCEPQPKQSPQIEG